MVINIIVLVLMGFSNLFHGEKFIGVACLVFLLVLIFALLIKKWFFTKKTKLGARQL